MSCTNCRDADTLKAIRNLGVAILLICWAVWMLIDDVQSMKDDYRFLSKRVHRLEESPAEDEIELEVKTNG